MFSTILLSHVTFRLVQFVITAADVAGLLTVQCITIDVAELCLRTVLKRDWHHAEAAGLLLQLALILVDVAVRSADRIRPVIFHRTSFTLNFILQACAWADMSRLNTASVEEEKKENQLRFYPSTAWHLQARCLLQFAFVCIRLGVSSTELVALSEDGWVFLLELLASDLGGLLAAVDFLQASLGGNHLDVFLLTTDD